jgi:hypothetical protein
VSLAEREGFEPSVQVLARYNGLAIVAIVDSLAMPCILSHLLSYSRTRSHLM